MRTQQILIVLVTCGISIFRATALPPLAQVPCALLNAGQHHSKSLGRLALCHSALSSKAH